MPIHYTFQHMQCLVSIVDYTHIYNIIYINQHIPYLVPFFTLLMELATAAPENSTNQAMDVLVKDKLQTPWDLAIVSKKQELHKSNNRTEHRSLILLVIQHVD